MNGPVLEIEVPWDVARSSMNRRVHHMARARLNRRAMEAATLAYRQAGSPELPDEAVAAVTYVARRGRRMDHENVINGAKPIIDALCRRRRNGHGVLLDDDDRHLSIDGVFLETGRQYKGRESLLLRFRIIETEGE